MSLEQFERWDLEQQLAEDLVKAYRRNAQLRATKVDLLRQIDAINKRLDKNTKAQDVLNDPKYAELDIRHDQNFLRKMEEKAAEKVLKKRKEKDGTEGANDSGDQKKKMTAEEKMTWLVEYLVKLNGTEPTIPEITKQLAEDGHTSGGSATQWLKPLKLPQNAVVWIQRGNKAQGKRLAWRHSTELRKALAEHGIKPQKKNTDDASE